MALILDSALPTGHKLRQEGLTVYSPSDGHAADLRIGIVNLMPIKEDAEADFMRLLGSTELTVEPVLIHMTSHRSRNTDAGHIARFYTGYRQAFARGLDGIIITGAPLERVFFTDVDYWREICEVFDEIRRRRLPSLNVCWGAYAWMFYYFGVEFEILERKISGVFSHRIERPEDPLMAGVEDGFYVPHSRFSQWDPEQVDLLEDVDIIARSDQEAGIYLLRHSQHPEYSFVGHGEYSTMTLDSEYHRDLGRGMNPHIPTDYYPYDDPARQPVNRWSETARRIYRNWLGSLRD